MPKPTPAGKSLDAFAQRHDPTHKVEAVEAVLMRDVPKGTKRFIVTAAQNGTPVHPQWWAILVNMAKLKGAELLVIPIRYKNPTSLWSGSARNAEYWDAPCRPYLWNQRFKLNSNLTLLADIKTQPTASAPLSGIDAMSLSASGIVGHTKMQLKSIATPSSRMAKILTTTGACTQPNYTNSSAGKIAEFHHSLSAVLVELDGSRFNLRQLHYDAKTNSCTDFGTRYAGDAYGEAPPPLALIMGDTHVDFIDPAVERATFGPGGIIETLRPKTLVWHDLLDSYSCNPHHFGNPFNSIAKRAYGRDDVRGEIDRAISFVRARTSDKVQSIIVPSNHNDFLRRWIIKNDWKEDPTNAEFYLETALEMVRGTKLTPKGTDYPDPFTFWFRRAAVPCARVLNLDESFVRGNVELGMHGDQGPNGARGSIKNIRRVGIRSVIGHSHSAGIDEGCVQVGTSTRLKLEYNHGASSWLNAHCLLNADGKRQLIVIVDGKWRLSDEV